MRPITHLFHFCYLVFATKQNSVGLLPNTAWRYEFRFMNYWTNVCKLWPFSRHMQTVLVDGGHVFWPILLISNRKMYFSPSPVKIQIARKSIMADFWSMRLFCKAHCGGLVCPIQSRLDSWCEELGLFKIEFLWLNYSVTSWLIGLIFLGKHLVIITRYWA